MLNEFRLKSAQATKPVQATATAIGTAMYTFYIHRLHQGILYTCIGLHFQRSVVSTVQAWRAVGSDVLIELNAATRRHPQEIRGTQGQRWTERSNACITNGPGILSGSTHKIGTKVDIVCGATQYTWTIGENRR